MIYTHEKFTNNCYTLKLSNVTKKHRVRLTNETKSFGDFKAMGLGFDQSKITYFRKKNSNIINSLARNSFKSSKLGSGSKFNKYEYFSPDMAL